MNPLEVLEPIINRKIEQPGDTRDAEGLLCCGKCGKRKQTRGTGLLAGRLLPVPCDCDRAKERQEREEEARREREALRRRCLPGEEMRRHRFETADETPGVLRVQRWCERWEDMRRDNIGLLLFGNTSTGKSFAAHCAANALIDRGITVRIYSASEIVARMSDREERRDAMEQVRRAPLLILDDVGAERGTEFAREQLCAVIDARCESGKPLIVTTNYTIGEMKNPVEPEDRRIFERLLGLCVPVKMTGESRRREIGAEKLRRAKELLT